MLRLLVLILILANGLYFAWSEGMLRAYGFAPAQQREPQRLAQQVRPEAIRVLTPAEFKRVEAQVQAELAPRECLVAGPFDDAQATSLRHVLESALAPGAWQIEAITVPARWIVYMGKFANAEALAKKQGELAAMKLVPQALTNPDLEIGLSLGAFATQAEATAELNKLSLRGIRTAKVLLERQEGKQSQLKLPFVTAEIKAQLADFKPVLAGKPLHSCN
ncbi:MAG: SPOR domain-containing protein [Rhodoferax sp.]|nr:SPOR domain-containing protein [Rhodoferax sp.]